VQERNRSLRPRALNRVKSQLDTHIHFPFSRRRYCPRILFTGNRAGHSMSLLLQQCVAISARFEGLCEKSMAMGSGGWPQRGPPQSISWQVCRGPV
jgi:hypothetical protein